MDRRSFMALSAGVAAALPLEAQIRRPAGTHLRLGLNAYSFNRPLMAGTMKLADVLDYCAAHNIDGVDLTGYYFPGYPAVPSDDFLYGIKRRAFLNGVTISGSGVRNDFAGGDEPARRRDIAMVKAWIDAAQKFGASVLRVFSGPRAPEGRSFDQVLEYMVPAFRECAAYAATRGVILGLQHHNDFLKTAEQTIRVIKAVNSEWFSVILDVGSLRQGDPYEEIARLIPYACTWQIKETVWYGEKETPIDLPRLRALIEKTGYRGFLPIESLAPGDPTAFLEKVRRAMIA
ncbi:MAG TPA: sugar phosphate isomerase/epimerase family protein [Bryobacteraceae bacterium]|jgi:sugar phosphate isomerase/epimerase|nr:sugar phosphate isomerase/epimerase family protein [Bryobacteraceae bacterium]